MDQHPVVMCYWIISDELSNCVNKAKLHIGLNVIRILFETTSQAGDNCTVRAVGVWSSLVLIFFEDEIGSAVAVTSSQYVHMMSEFLFPHDTPS